MWNEKLDDFLSIIHGVMKGDTRVYIMVSQQHFTYHVYLPLKRSSI
jgi:hypothetical protein